MIGISKPNDAPILWERITSPAEGGARLAVQVADAPGFGPTVRMLTLGQPFAAPPNCRPGDTIQVCETYNLHDDFAPAFARWLDEAHAFAAQERRKRAGGSP